MTALSENFEIEKVLEGLAITSSSTEKNNVDGDGDGDHGVTLITSLEKLEWFQRAASGKTIVSFDAEGVDLSRIGTLTIVSIAIQVDRGVHVFLFDIIHEDINLRNAQQLALKAVLEDKSIEKIVHDCRQDSDALAAQLSINLTNVFDTSVIILEIKNDKKRLNLNQALKEFNCPVNENRDEIANMYRLRPDFWRARPITPFMIEYASKDVATLFELRAKLSYEVDRLFPSAEGRATVMAKCDQAISAYRSMPKHEVVEVPSTHIGLVIGRGGRGIEAIERKSGGGLVVATIKDNRSGFLVVAPNQKVLRKAKKAIEKIVESAAPSSTSPQK